MSKTLRIILTIALWCVTLVFVKVESKTPDVTFIQLWVTKNQYQELQNKCQSTTEVRIDYPDSSYAVIPCKVLK